MLGLPVTGYSLDIGREHTEFAEARLQRRLAERAALEDADIDALAVMAVGGMAAEGANFDEVRSSGWQPAQASILIFHLVSMRPASPEC